MKQHAHVVQGFSITGVECEITANITVVLAEILALGWIINVGEGFSDLIGMPGGVLIKAG